jgi:hypothetical protein
LAGEEISELAIRITQNANAIMRRERLRVDSRRFTAYLASSIGKKLCADIKSQEERFNQARVKYDFISARSFFQIDDAK